MAATIAATGGESPHQMRDAIGQFPARPLTPDERALLAEWVATAGDIAKAYMSNRREDDPAHYRRIVIVTRDDEGPSYFVHAPSGRDIWVVFSFRQKPRTRRFHTLRAALNSIRPVLVDVGVKVSLGKPKA